MVKIKEVNFLIFLVGKKGKGAICTSLTWNSLGKKLFAGFSDGTIRVWHAEQRKN